MSGHLLDGLLTNLCSPAVLFFVLGMFAALVKSDLKFPEALYVSFTIYLLCAIGFKGGVAISDAGLGRVWLPALAATAIGSMTPIWTYPLLRFVGKLPVADAAAIAGHYGSVSAVTFIAATNFLAAQTEPYEGYATAFLAVMEAPAIIVAIFLAKAVARAPVDSRAVPRGGMGSVLDEALLGRSVILLLAALLAGFLCGKKGMDAVAGFFVT